MFTQQLRKDKKKGSAQEKCEELSSDDEELPSLVKCFREFESDGEEHSEDELSKDLPRTGMSQKKVAEHFIATSEALPQQSSETPRYEEASESPYSDEEE